MRLTIPVSLAFVLLLLAVASCFWGTRMVLSGPLDANSYFTEQRKSAFDSWSNRLLQIKTGFEYSRGGNTSLIAGLNDFMSEQGVLSVSVSHDGQKVDWLLSGGYRVYAHYIMTNGKNDGGAFSSDGGNSWTFNVDAGGGREMSCEDLWIELASRQRCRVKVMVLISIFLIASLAIGFGSVGGRARGVVPDSVYLMAVVFSWIVDVILIFALAVGVGVNIIEWLRMKG